MSKRRDNSSRLQQLFDGELSQAEAGRIYRQADPAGLRQLADMGQLRQLIRESAQESAAEADLDQLWPRISSALKQEERSSARSPARSLGWADLFEHWGRWAAGGATMAAVILGVLWFQVPTASAQRNDCVIESLNVDSETTSTIFTIDDADSEDATTVIWLSEGDL